MKKYFQKPTYSILQARQRRDNILVNRCILLNFAIEINDHSHKISYFPMKCTHKNQYEKIYKFLFLKSVTFFSKLLSSLNAYLSISPVSQHPPKSFFSIKENRHSHKFLFQLRNLMIICNCRCSNSRVYLESPPPLSLLLARDNGQRNFSRVSRYLHTCEQ